MPRHDNQHTNYATPARSATKHAQDLGRHTARAAANHLSVLEQAQADHRNRDRDVAALERMIAPGSPLRPLKPPGRRR